MTTTVTAAPLRINEPPGTIVSLVPLTDCTGVTAESFEYPLRDTDLPFAIGGLPVSNITCEDAAVSLKSGILIVIIARDQKNL